MIGHRGFHFPFGDILNNSPQANIGKDLHNKIIFFHVSYAASNYKALAQSHSRSFLAATNDNGTPPTTQVKTFFLELS
jgi:hypothetical protein